MTDEKRDWRREARAAAASAKNLRRQGFRGIMWTVLWVLVVLVLWVALVIAGGLVVDRWF